MSAFRSIIKRESSFLSSGNFMDGDGDYHVHDDSWLFLCLMVCRRDKGCVLMLTILVTTCQDSVYGYSLVTRAVSC